MTNRLTAMEIGKIPKNVKGEALKKAIVTASMKTDCDTDKTYKAKKK